MGTIADKLSKLLNTKAQLKAALVEKGQAVEDSEPFSAYPDKVLAIQAGNTGYQIGEVAFTLDTATNTFSVPYNGSLPNNGLFWLGLRVNGQLPTTKKMLYALSGPFLGNRRVIWVHSSTGTVFESTSIQSAVQIKKQADNILSFVSSQYIFPAGNYVLQYTYE